MAPAIVVTGGLGLEHQGRQSGELHRSEPVDDTHEVVESLRPTSRPALPAWRDAEVGEHEIDQHRGRAATVERTRRREHGPMPDPEPGSGVAEQPAETVSRRLDVMVADPHRGGPRAGNEHVAVGGQRTRVKGDEQVGFEGEPSGKPGADQLVAELAALSPRRRRQSRARHCRCPPASPRPGPGPPGLPRRSP